MAKLRFKSTRFTNRKNSVIIHEVNTNRILVSTKVLFSKKGFNISLPEKMLIKVIPLCETLPKICSYRRNFDKIKKMPF